VDVGDANPTKPPQRPRKGGLLPRFGTAVLWPVTDFNAELMDDLDVDVLQPEVLVYAPGPRGRLQLVAVESVARGPNTNPPGVSEPPTVLGMPMHILVPAVGFYIKHAWVWRSNPAGMFADWNPRVTCP
jgi:hypothetical protein